MLLGWLGKKKSQFSVQHLNPHGSKLYCKFKRVLYKSGNISIGIDDLFSLSHV